MQILMELLLSYGLAAVFLSVLVEQLGAPVPAYPILMLGGALAARGQYNPWSLLALAIVACLLADSVWYLAGRRHGRKVLGLLCRISLSPDVCVRQTEAIFTRWGAPSLTMAKFVPGFASVSTAMAGAIRVERWQFLVYDSIGAALWAGLGLALGWVFSDAIEEVLATLAELGKWGLIVLALALAGFVVSKWLRRRRFKRELRMQRITVQSLTELVSGNAAPLIVDVRSAAARSEGGIVGAHAYTGHVLSPTLNAAARDRLVAVYCACPGEASAVMAARELMQHGFTNVVALEGGIDAWRAAGNALEPVRSD